MDKKLPYKNLVVKFFLYIWRNYRSLILDDSKIVHDEKSN